MKLTVAQLESHLTQTLEKVYLVHGDEPFLAQEALSFIQQKAATADYRNRLRLDIETDSDLNNIYNHVYTLPLLGSKRFIELHWKDNKLSKASQQFLQHYALQPSPHNVLVSYLGKLDSKTEQMQWFKTLEKNTIIISTWPLTHNKLLLWIMQRASSRKLHLTPEAGQLLAYYVEGNLPAAAQEIEKLSLLDLPRIDRPILEALVVDQGCFSAFDLVNQALMGNGPQVLRILYHLQKEGIEPLMILGAFTFELRTLAKLANEMKKGASLTTLFAQYHLRPRKQIGIREFFKRGNEEHLLGLFLKAGEIDRLAKRTSHGDVWLALEELSLTVTGLEPLYKPFSAKLTPDNGPL